MSEKEPHVLIGTPCYGGMCHEGYNSMISTMTNLPKCKVGVSIKTITNESLVTRARNHIADCFIKTKNLLIYFYWLNVTFTYQQIIECYKLIRI